MTGPQMTDVWPLCTIDFEASSLDDGTYPIEVGIARWQEPDAPIQTWSTLIKPLPNWERHGSWTHSAEEVHGITRRQLGEGMTARKAMDTLNAMIGKNVAHCDGGAFDRKWFEMLQYAAGRTATFTLSSYQELRTRLYIAGNFTMHVWHEEQHRAGPDALRLMLAIAYGYGIEDPGIQPYEINGGAKPSA